MSGKPTDKQCIMIHDAFFLNQVAKRAERLRKCDNWVRNDAGEGRAFKIGQAVFKKVAFPSVVRELYGRAYFLHPLHVEDSEIE